MTGVCVDRCLCHGVTFAELKEVADACGIADSLQLQGRVKFGTGCGLCLPYVSVMLRTGRVSFDELIPGDGDVKRPENDNS